MRAIIPSSLSFLYKVFEARQKYYYCGAVLGMYSFDQSENLFAGPELWKTAAQELGPQAVLDLCMPKPNGEVLVTGACYAGPDDAAGKTVELKFGSISKQLYVFGPRHWRKNGGMSWSISKPLPFDKMDITYERAFGGPGYEKNPDGIGLAPTFGSQGKEYHPLPNVEDPAHLIGDPADRPEPAGFGPLDITWPQRMSKAGTYDQKWLETLFPGLAADIDMTYFNLAPPDQWIKDFFIGDESFSVQGMHPEKAVVDSRLPGLRVRQFILRQVNGEDRFSEIKTRLDTVWLFPHLERAILIYHGTVEIATDDARDVSASLLAYERITDEPRPADHYYKALQNRQGGEKAALYLLYDKDLIPPEARSPWTEFLKPPETEHALVRNMKRRKEYEEEQAKERLEQVKKQVRKDMEKAREQVVGGADGLESSLLQVREELEKAGELFGVSTDQLESWQEKLKQPLDFEAIDSLLEQAAAKLRKLDTQPDSEVNIPGLDLPPLDLPEVDPYNFDPEQIYAAITAAKSQAKEYMAKKDDIQAMAEAKKREAQEKLLELLQQFDLETPKTRMQEVLAKQNEFPGLDEAQKKETREKLREALQKLNLDPDEILARFDATPPPAKRPIVRADEHLDQFRNTKAKLEKDWQEMQENMDAYQKQINQQLQSAGRQADDQGFASHSETFAQQVDLGFASHGEAFAQQMDKINPDDPELIERLAEAEVKTKEMYRDHGHHFPPPAPPTEQEAQEIAATFESILESRGSFREVDLKGIDLSNRDLRNIDLSGAFLEGADLTGANLSGANLSEAILIQANLTRVRASQANCRKTNFGQAVLTGADFAKAEMEKAVLAKANLKAASFQSADLTKADFMGAVFDYTDFTEAKINGIWLIPVPSADSVSSMDEINFEDLSFLPGIKINGVSFRDADISETLIINPQSANVDFTGAKANGLTVIGGDMSGAVFNHADLTNARFMNKVNLAGAEFHHAILDRANLMEANLEGANLAKASLTEAVLLHTNLQRANGTGLTARKATFYKANLEEAILIGADLMEANLYGARLVAADLRWANLYSAEVFRVVLGKTNLHEANLKMTKIKSLEQ